MASFQLKPQMRGKGHLKTSEKSIPRRKNSMCKGLEAHTKNGNILECSETGKEGSKFKAEGSSQIA